MSPVCLKRLSTDSPITNETDLETLQASSCAPMIAEQADDPVMPSTHEVWFPTC